MDIHELLKKSAELKASDLHITVGLPPISRIHGHLEKLTDQKLTPADTEGFIRMLLNENQFSHLEQKGEIDFSVSVFGMYRYRVNAYKQRNSYAAAMRLVESNIKSFEQLGLPSTISDFCNKTRGLVLVTGPTGSGKSTTLAAMIDQMNRTRDCHILTLEDPIEYLHRHQKSIVNQREIGNDSMSYSNALRSALRQDPDIILIGEMRDLETIGIALTAAETGHLVLSTLHTIGAAKTIDRIIDVFPPHQQQQIRTQLSMTLQGVISQQLIPRSDQKGRIAAIEIMMASPAIRNLIREGKTPQINNVIMTSARLGMRTMDNSIAEYYQKGIISKDDTLLHCIDLEYIKRLLHF
ncbi:MAG: type IV pilus twitching motility protein PilT [Clostridiales bacterium]|nr:type IV pilus twitching motility protein PilT [Clostridiales bacterium]